MSGSRWRSAVVFLLVVLVVLGAACLPAVAAEEAPIAEETDLWDQVRAWYNEAKEAGEQVPGNIYDWIKQDLQGAGDWEYRVLQVDVAADRLLEEELNRLGSDRWECIWIQPRKQGLRLFLKRPVKSYLRNVSLPDLMKVIPVGGGSD
jgi:hypothetical protein